MGEKRIYFFEEGKAEWRGLLGGKGANLAEMTRLGLPVPPGFTITTAVCNEYYALGQRFPEGLEEELAEALSRLEEKTGKAFGRRENPLLVSVRSGAAISMPGMMDTILNLGLNDETVEGVKEATGDERFAYDSYRRFIQMFGNVVLRLEHRRFEQILERHKEKLGVKFDQELPGAALKQVVREYLSFIKEETGREFPQDPREQLIMAVKAVFDSWNNPRAILYRQIHKIPDDLGTAVNVQSMVFGNMGDDSGTGVVFTRNPSTGEKVLYGEYLSNAQGEDVVAGLRTPLPVARLEQELPGVYRELVRVADLLEQHYGDMQDIEFTVEKGRLFMLQTRNGKRSAAAAVRIAVDLVKEGKISRETALLRVEPEQVVQLLHRGIDPASQARAIAVGLPASPGAATGAIVFDADDAEIRGGRGEKVILVRPETAPDDMHGIVAAQGILTSRGGMTCHAAIVARGMGKPCVVGCEALRIDLEEKKAVVGDLVLREGDVITIDGATGRVIPGDVPKVEPQLSSEFLTLLSWADEFRTLGVRANADTPEDAAKARELGAEGIGLCRTEHMFMAPDRLPVVQEMIMAQTPEERRAALNRLLPMQQGDFEGIFRAMQGYPVTIRLLDPPLHEFLPDREELLEELAELRARGASAEQIKEKEELLRKARSLAEANPMLGFRGCRLGIVYPEIYEMQARAIFQAAVKLMQEGLTLVPEVMLPLVGHINELRVLKERIRQVADQVMAETGHSFRYLVGTMIEVPRAALTAGELAQEAEFFSFGTNDLTQTTFGFSRDDAEARFLHHYLHEKILPENPFIVLDTAGVGQLIQMATVNGRQTRPQLKVGICGEHGGDPKSIGFCHRAGLNYVSASPYRVPIARLAAAQARIRERLEEKKGA